jgi:hypothetical protein
MYQITIKFTKWAQNIQNGSKIDQHSPLQANQKLTLCNYNFWFKNMASGNPDFWTNVFISFFHTRTTHIMYVSQFEHSSIAFFPKKPYTLTGFEPLSSVPEADAMSTASRRQSLMYYPQLKI